MTYDETIRGVAQTYSDVILRKLDDIKAQAAEAGCEVAGPQTMWDDEFRWEMSVKTVLNGYAAVVFELQEERAYDDEEGFGVNWSLTVLDEDSHVLDVWSPYNYTPQVWVDSRDREAVADRFGFLQSVESALVVSALLGVRT